MQLKWVRLVQLGLATFMLISLLVACASITTSGHSDAELQDIIKRYPELSGKTAEIAVVARVVDGDTIETDTKEKVRLIGVNTPEKHGKTEYYGEEASKYTTTRLTGKTVYLFKDVSETDRYGRLLRFVFIKGESVMFNETLLVEGYANVSTYSPDVTYAEYFLQFERSARENGIGLWAEQEGQMGQGDTGNDQAACDNPNIKGNINSKKEKIYHVPGGRSYEQTKAEVMFCTVEEAEAEGFRAASK